MKSSHRLGNLQLAIMRVLWQRKEATAAEVHTILYPERGLAPTTIATMLRKMETKGVVAHRTEGRQFVYAPAVTESEVRRSMVADLTAHLFQGDAAALVSHLLDEGEIDGKELERLRALIRSRAAERGEGR